MLTEWQKDIAILVALGLSLLEVLVGVTAIVISERKEPDAAATTRAKTVRRLVFMTFTFLLASEVVVLPLALPFTEKASVFFSTLAMFQSGFLCIAIIRVFAAARKSPHIAM